MALLALPDELVLEIAQYLIPAWDGLGFTKMSSRQSYHLDITLQSLCAVNHRIRTICLPAQFQVLVIGVDSPAPEKEADFIRRTLLSRSDISTYLRSVHLVGKEVANWSRPTIIGIQWIYLNQIVQDVLKFAPGLVLLDITHRLLPSITAQLLGVINEHPSLKTIAINSPEPLLMLDAETIQSTSLSRISCRSLSLAYTTHSFSRATMGEVLRTAGGARLRELTIYSEGIPQEWESLFLNGLETLEINMTRSSPNLFLEHQAISFMARHPSLKIIRVSMRLSQFLPSRILSPLPCMAELYALIAAERLDDSTLFSSLGIKRNIATSVLKGGSEASSWCITKACLSLRKNCILSLPLFTETVQFTDLLRIQIDDTDKSEVTIHDLFNAVEACHSSLQKITRLEFPRVPLWESGAANFDTVGAAGGIVLLDIDEFDFRDHELDEFNNVEDQDKAWLIVEEGLRVYADHLVQFVQKLGALCPLLEAIEIGLDKSATGICYKFESKRVGEGHESLSTVTWNFTFY